MKNIIHKIKANSFSLLVLVVTSFTIIYSNYQVLFSNSTKLNVNYLTIQCIYTTVGVFLTLLIFEYFKNENTVRWLFICYLILSVCDYISLTIVDFNIRGGITNGELFLLPLLCWTVAYPSSKLISKFIDRFNLNKSSEN